MAGGTSVSYDKLESTDANGTVGVDDEVLHKMSKTMSDFVSVTKGALECLGGILCDVDVVEFLYYGAPTATHKEQLYSKLVEGLQGNDPWIGAGSQDVARTVTKIAVRKSRAKDLYMEIGPTYQHNL